MSRRLDQKKGFSLLEVLMALGILASAIILVTTTWSGNLSRLRKSRWNHVVAQLLERKIIELEAKYEGKPLEEITDEKGNFGEEYKNYSWEFVTQDFEMPDLTPLLIGQNDGASDTIISVIRQMSESISKSIKEATITVFVKIKKRTLKYSVTTYFVDYNRDLGLGGGESTEGANTSGEDTNIDQGTSQ